MDSYELVGQVIAVGIMILVSYRTIKLLIDIYELNQFSKGIIPKQKDVIMLKLELAPVGNFTTPIKGKTVDLSQYYIDEAGQLYSGNLLTWEINKRMNRDLLICSNNCIQGTAIINSLRGDCGTKVTLARKTLKFNELALVNGIIKIEGYLSTPRHIKVTNKVS